MSTESRVAASGIGQPFGVEIGPDGALCVTEIEQHRIIRGRFRSPDGVAAEPNHRRVKDEIVIPLSC